MRQDVRDFEVPAFCRTCRARDRGLCGVLAPAQLRTLERQVQRHGYAPGSELIAAGAEVQRYANILSGAVKLTMMMPDSRQQIVGLQFAPDFLGRPFQAESGLSAEAASTVRICAFPKGALEALLRQSPELEHRLHLQALRELDEAREWMLKLGRKTALEKVASFLLLLARRSEQDSATEPIRFDIALSRAEIADALGLTIETVSRQMTQLRKSRTIAMETPRIVTVLDIARLAGAAGEQAISRAAPAGKAGFLRRAFRA
jgi:CRP/FNR family transcriptional regulator, anaerobic regulatory protein